MLQTQADEFLDYVIKEWAKSIEIESAIGYEFLGKSTLNVIYQHEKQEPQQSQVYVEVPGEESLGFISQISSALQESCLSTRQTNTGQGVNASKKRYET